MKILFVHPAAEISVSDVARGYRSALERAGHDVADYNLRGRMEYHSRALPPGIKDDVAFLARCASETILNEAMYEKADIVLIMSGLNVHPICLWLLGQVGIRAAVVLTESPYNDEEQKQWADLTKVDGAVDVTLFTNDRYSSEFYGWHLLAPSFDPSIHKPVDVAEEEVCDVLMVATGWQERQAFLEAVDWAGIDLRLYGVWPTLTAESPLHQFYNPLVVDNTKIASLYCSARICLNFNRKSQVALTPGPRVYETAACGGFQLSDPRADIQAIFGDNVPTFDSPNKLRELILFYLNNPDIRATKAEKARNSVQWETFDHRAAELMAVLQRAPEMASA